LSSLSEFVRKTVNKPVKEDLDRYLKVHKFPLFAEPKFDGERVLILIDGDAVTIANQHNRVYSEDDLPEALLKDLRKAFDTPVLLDGEFISTQGDLYDFLKARARLDESLALRIWDVLSIDLNTPLSKRREFLEQNMRQTERVSLVPQVLCESRKDVMDYFNKSVEQGYEGIVLKPDAGYYAKWLKMRKLHTIDVVILGIRKTDEWVNRKVPASFLVGYYNPKTKAFEPLGNVSSGLSLTEKEAIGEVAVKTGEDKDYVYIEPTFVVEIAYHVKRSTGLRFPKMIRLRFDKKPQDCVFG